jgi:hypothetical protein
MIRISNGGCYVARNSGGGGGGTIPDYYRPDRYFRIITTRIVCLLKCPFHKELMDNSDVGVYGEGNDDRMEGLFPVSIISIDPIFSISVIDTTYF